MNGILTALLGGASGVGQGLQYQDQRQMAQNAQDLERAKMRADLIMQGFDPDSTNGPTQPPGISTIASPSPVAAAPMSAPNGPPQGVLTSLLCGKDGMRGVPASAPPPAMQGAPPDAAAGGASGVSGVGGPAFSSFGMQPKRVDLPGLGGFTYNPMNGPIFRQVMIEALKNKNATDEKIRESAATGATDRNKADTDLLRHRATEILPGDPGYIEYMSKLEGSKALATLPAKTQEAVLNGRITLGNALVEEDARAKHEAARQTSQQTFEQGQQGRAQTFEQGQQGREQAFQRGQQGAAYVNHSNEISQQQRGTITGKLLAPPPATAAPTALPQLTADQIARAAVNPTYRAFLNAQGYRNY